TKGGEVSPALKALDDQRLGGRLARALQEGDFRGGEEDGLLLYGGTKGPHRVVVLGMGREAEVTAETFRRFAGRAVRQAETLRLTALALRVELVGGLEAGRVVQSVAEGAALAAWDFREL